MIKCPQCKRDLEYIRELRTISRGFEYYSVPWIEDEFGFDVDDTEEELDTSPEIHDTAHWDYRCPYCDHSLSEYLEDEGTGLLQPADPEVFGPEMMEHLL